MIAFAYFDADGVCITVAQSELEIPEGGAARIVDERARPNDIWFDGETVRETTLATIEIPEAIDVGSQPFTVELPDGVIASVNGERQRGVLTIPTDEPASFSIDLRGAQTGNFLLRVMDYADRRRAAYPTIPDQLDTLYHEGLEGWREQVQSVKDAYPKPE